MFNQVSAELTQAYEALQARVASLTEELAVANGELRRQFQEKEALIAALKIIALGEKDRVQGKGISVVESRAQLLAARQNRK